MQTKLTLQIDDQLVRRAKDYARKSGASVSKIVENFFRVLDRQAPKREEEDLTPTVRSLIGVMNKRSGNEKDSYRYLERKQSILMDALSLNFQDFEDAVLHEAVSLPQYLIHRES